MWQWYGGGRRALERCLRLARAGQSRLAGGIAVLGVVLLSGCASTVTTDVTAFRQPDWQNDSPRTYAFDRAKGEESQLDRDTFEGWVAETLGTLGFEKVTRPKARYLVRVEFDADPRLVRVQETYYGDPWYPGWGPYWGPPGYRGMGPWGPWGPWGPGYWPPQTVVRDVPVTLSTLRVYFQEAATNRRVYQVTAQNMSEGAALSGVMPYLIRSAFTDFPLDSGRPRRVTLEVDKSQR